MSGLTQKASNGGGVDTPGEESSSHGSYKSYITGFLLSVILTVIPFWVVMSDTPMHLGAALTIIFVLGTGQILVHIYYFLHVDLRAEQGWQAMSLIFTGIILFVVLAGSIWVMYHLHTNMMPPHFINDAESVSARENARVAAPDGETTPETVGHSSHE